MNESNEASDMGFDVPTTPQETGVRSTALDIDLNPPRVTAQGLSQPHPSPIRLPDPVLRDMDAPVALADDDEPMPTDFAEALTELTLIQSYVDSNPIKERTRMRRRVLLGEHVIRMQNGEPAPSSITADEQALARLQNPFDHAKNRLAELSAKYPDSQIAV